MKKKSTGLTLGRVMLYFVFAFIILIKFFATPLGDFGNGCSDDMVLGDSHRLISRSWRDYEKQAYCVSYSISDPDYQSSRFQRVNLNPFDRIYTDGYWTTVYSELHKQDQPFVAQLCDSLQNLDIYKTLNRTQFAELAMSFVQDIDYAYVMPGDQCQTKEYSDHPCVGNEKFGVLSPIEFLYTLKGDCDTRCILLYSIFDYFGYDVVIATSNEYAHAMIGVNLPGTGDFITHNGIKYYLWETTAMGWQMGMMPQDANNINYWEIDLD